MWRKSGYGTARMAEEDKNARRGGSEAKAHERLARRVIKYNIVL
jgi:hypothetical protein